MLLVKNKFISMDVGGIEFRVLFDVLSKTQFSLPDHKNFLRKQSCRDPDTHAMTRTNPYCP